MRLVTMPVHFKNSPDVQTDFELSVVAFVSLRREGYDRLTSVQLNGRVELISWVLDSLGLPVHRFMVVPLSEASSLSNPVRFVTLNVGGKFQVGAMLPHATSPGLASILCPSSSLGVQIRSRSTLFTQRGEDVKQILEAGQTSSPHLLVAPKEERDATVGDLSKSSKKATNMLKSAISGAMLVLDNFANTDWEELKESCFTAPLQKLMAGKLEVAHEQLESLIQEADFWYEELSNLKMCVKKYREAMRSRKDQASKLGAMNDLAAKAYVFLKTKIAINTNFALVCLKCKFYSNDKNLEVRDFTARFKDMVELDLFQVLSACDASSPGQHKADAWLRALLVDHTCTMIRQLAPEEVEQARCGLGKAFGEVANVLANAQGTADILASVQHDMHMLETLFLGGTDAAPKFSALGEAEKHVMQSPRLALLRQVLTDTPAGTEILSPLVQMKSMSANDEIGDQRFELGTQCFQDKAMLSVELRLSAVGNGVNDTPVYLVSCADQVLKSPMLLEPMLMDAMANVVESRRLWCHARLEIKEPEVLNFIANLGSTLCAAQFVQALDMFLACKAAFEMVGESADEPADLHALALSLAGAIQTTPLPSTANLVEYVKNMSQEFSGNETLLEAIQGIVDVAVANQTLRQAIGQVLDSYRSVVSIGLPTNASTAIEQWKARGSESCLAQSIEMFERLDFLEHLSTFAFDTVSGDHDLDAGVLKTAEVYISTDPDTIERTGITMNDIVNFKQKVLELPIAPFLKDLVQACVSSLLDDFMSACELDALAREMTEKEPETLTALVHNFVKPNQMTSTTKSMTQVLASGKLLGSKEAFIMMKCTMSVSKVQEIEVSNLFIQSTCTLNCELVKAVAEVYMHVHHVSGVLAWIGTTCSSANACVSNNRIKPELVSALAMIDHHLDDCETVLAKNEALWPMLAVAPSTLCCTVSTCASWIGNVRKSYIPLCHMILQSVLSSMTALTKLVKSHTPSYDHYLDDTTINVRLLKSKLLSFGSKDILTQKSIELFKLLQDIGRFRAECGLVTSTTVENSDEDSLGEASSAFKAAKKAMAIIAATNIAFGMSGPAQISEGQKLVRSPGEVPNALIKELEKAISKGASRPSLVK